MEKMGSVEQEIKPYTLFIRVELCMMCGIRPAIGYNGTGQGVCKVCSEFLLIQLRTNHPVAEKGF